MARRSDLAGGTPEENALMMRALFAGAQGPIRDIVLLNAAAGLVVAGRSASLRDAVSLGAVAIDNGGASQVLDRLVAFTTSTS